MKPLLTGFFDHDQITIQDQLDNARLHNISEVSLRMVNGFKLGEIDGKTYQDILNTVKKSKQKVVCLDPNLDPYDLYQEKRHKEAIETYKEIMILANKIKTPYIALRLPKFQNVIEEIEVINPYIEDYIHLAQQYHKKYILIPSSEHKANTYAYILKKFKTNILNMSFDPVYFYLNGESTTTSYRLLKKHITFIRANDCDIKGTPKLLGHGKTDFLKIAKRLIRDKYQGYIFVDNRLDELIHRPEPEVKKSIFKKIFTKSQKKQLNLYEDLKMQLKWQDPQKNVTYDDILDNQIKLLNYIFRV
ncbi:MAG: hypothetical protein ACNA7K_03175 [Acholeplasmataceae bacterium]